MNDLLEVDVCQVKLLKLKLRSDLMYIIVLTGQASALCISVMYNSPIARSCSTDSSLEYLPIYLLFAVLIFQLRCCIALWTFLAVHVHSSPHFPTHYRSHTRLIELHVLMT